MDLIAKQAPAYQQDCAEAGDVAPSCQCAEAGDVPRSCQCKAPPTLPEAFAVQPLPTVQHNISVVPDRSWAEPPVVAQTASHRMTSRTLAPPLPIPEPTNPPTQPQFLSFFPSSSSSPPAPPPSPSHSRPAALPFPPSPSGLRFPACAGRLANHPVSTSRRLPVCLQARPLLFAAALSSSSLSIWGYSWGGFVRSEFLIGMFMPVLFGKPRRVGSSCGFGVACRAGLLGPWGAMLPW